jgi:DNA-binding transcriptional MerR regulator
MFRIGDFSRIARVSARLLRFYDEIGLLEPAHADAHSGYRYYTAAQLARLNRITVLKDLGFSLEQIGDILKADISAGELRNMLLMRRNDVERTLTVEAQRLRHIELRITQIETEGRLSAEDVVVRPEPARQLLSMRRTVASFREARGMLDALQQLAAPLLSKRHAGQAVVISHSPQFEQEELDLEFGLAFDLDAPIRSRPGSGLTLGELPAVERMAVCVRNGPPDEAYLVTSRIGAFLEQNGETLGGPNRELFLHLPEPSRVQDSVVEMQFPLQTR